MLGSVNNVSAPLASSSDPDQIRTGSAADGASNSKASLLPKAKEFESILLTQWLQGAESTFGTVPGADDDQGAGDDQIKSFALQQLAKGLSDAGGIGIASLVLNALTREGASNVSPMQNRSTVSR